MKLDLDMDKAPVQQKEQLALDMSNLMSTQSERSSKKIITNDVPGAKVDQETLINFLNTMEFGDKRNTARVSYKTKEGQEYQIYGVGKQMYMQSEQGFQYNLAPLKVTAEQRMSIIEDFQEIRNSAYRNSAYENLVTDERVARCVYYTEDKSQQEIERIEKAILNSQQRNQVKSFDRNAPSRGAHASQIQARNNKTFWSSGVENGIKSVP